MDIRLIRVFQGQVEIQCHFILLAHEALNDALRIRGVEKISPVFFAVQNMLNAAANISKALWGQRGRKAQERQELRRSLDISEDSPFRQVDMRNNFEHFDERVEHWWLNSARRNYVDRNVMPLNAIRGIPDTDIFRHFDPASGELWFWGQRFDVRAIVAEAARVHPIARRRGDAPDTDGP